MFATPLRKLATHCACFNNAPQLLYALRFPRFATKKRFLSALGGASDFECDETLDDGEAQKKADALRYAITRLAGDFSKESMLSLQRFFSSRRAPVISTGSLKLDMALGIGGFPLGRMVEIYGNEASGKTTLALHVIKEAQKLGGYCAYLDVENALDSSMAESIGIKLENLLIAPPDSAENMLSMVDTLIKSGALDVIVVDSVAALLPQNELDSTIVSCESSTQSRILSQALRKIHHTLCQSKTCLILLNQVRHSSNILSGCKHKEEATCGGDGLKFYSCIRLRTSKVGLLKIKKEVKGIEVCVKVVKNKLAPIVNKTGLAIKFGKGFCLEEEVLEIACEYGMIVKEGCTYSILGKMFHDKCMAIDYLANDANMVYDLSLALRREMFPWNVEVV